ncbi:MAG: DUF4397 domain-containing protein [Anaerolinea sp.]|nr:DUF4397 domain-containing protein [Anaerolinea sp.]MCC6975464.1 DUF4397 domain-containing protein [Anaerolineae bacterium]
MKANLNRLFALMVIAALMLTGIGVAQPALAQGGQAALLRFVHAVPGAGAVDVYVDGVLAASNLRFGQGTRFLNVDAGNRAVIVTPAGQQSPIFTGAVPATTDLGHTVVVQGTPSSIEVGLYEDELFPVRAGSFRLTAVHAIKGAPAVDVLLVNGANVTPLIQGLAYGSPFGTLDIPATAGDLVAVPAGGSVEQALFTASAVSLVAGTYNMVVAVGAPAGDPAPKALVLTAPTQAEDAAASTLISFAHASPEAPEVDIYINGTLVAPRAAFGAVTPHVAMPGGALEVVLRIAGAPDTDAPVTTANITSDAGTAATVVISGGLDALNVKAFPDNIGNLDATKARVRLINALTDGAATVTLPSGEPVSSSEAAGVDVAAVSGTGKVSVDGGDVDVSVDLALNGGVLFNLILAGRAVEPQVFVGATTLNERPGSVGQLMTADVAPVATATPVEGGGTGGGSVFLPTLAPTVPPAPTEAPPPPTVVVQQPTPAPFVPPPAPTPRGKTGWLGTVATNPGVNLKLREYPSTDAKTLALVPSGQVVEVDGLKGPIVNESEPTPSVTPTLSFEGKVIEDLWVFVTWTTDAGRITGWTKPQYLQVKDAKGNAVFKIEQWFSLPLIPENQFGVVSNPAATPITQRPDEVIATVIVDPGVNLQLRRTPSINGESMQLLPNGTKLIALEQTTVESLGGLVGEPQSTIWLYVRFETETGVITGWINSGFVTLNFKGRPFELSELPVATEIKEGTIEGTGLIITQPPKQGLMATVDKVNPGANLQLRRSPDAGSESLALIPAGSQVPVLGRNESATWFQVQYNGIEGWINGFYVTVTDDGKRLKDVFEDVKNVTDLPDVTLTPSPTATPGG